MPNLRVIPCVLGKSGMAVKGERFDNWRVTGTAQATALVQGKRSADEFMFLDVEASSQGSYVSLSLTAALSEGLRVPFCVGGGIDSIDYASKLFASGADKLLIGRAARAKEGFLSDLVNTFGSQSISCSVDVISTGFRMDRCEYEVNAQQVPIAEMVKRLQNLGAGEIVLTHCELDGTRKGLDISCVDEVAKVAEVPLVVGSGAAGIGCFKRAFDAGASGVFAGALFQFTQATPDTIRAELRDSGYLVRQKII